MWQRMPGTPGSNSSGEPIQFSSDIIMEPAPTSLLALHALPLHLSPRAPADSMPAVAAPSPQPPLVKKRTRNKPRAPQESVWQRKVRPRKTPYAPCEIARMLMLQNETKEEREARLEVEREARFRKKLAKMAGEVPKCMKRPTPPMPQVTRPDPVIAEKVERKFLHHYATRCYCPSCHRARRELAPVDKYACCIYNCKHQFDDLADFLEHQLASHGAFSPFCRRVREAYYRQEQNGRSYPPETVYIGFQFLTPWERPTLWTMERVEHEFETRFEMAKELAKLRGTIKGLFKKSFPAAYEKVKMYGESQLNEQYHVALEYYESALVFSTGPRNRQDTFANVGLGRNWFLSPEPENAERTRLIKLASTMESNSDESESDEEVVLFRIENNVKQDKVAPHLEPLEAKEPPAVEICL